MSRIFNTGNISGAIAFLAMLAVPGAVEYAIEYNGPYITPVILITIMVAGVMAGENADKKQAPHLQHAGQKDRKKLISIIRVWKGKCNGKNENQQS